MVFDIDAVLRNRHSGFFTYGVGLLSGLARLGNAVELTLLDSGKTRGRREWLAEAALAPQRWVSLPGKPRYWQAWWRGLPWPALQHWTGPFEVYHCNHHLMPPTRTAARVLTVHDLRRQRFPDFYPHSKTGAFERAVRQADRIIAISAATRRDLQELLQVPGERIDVVHHGGPLWSDRPAADSGQVERLGLTPGRYFVAFSSYDQRKNLARILRAFAQAAGPLGGEWRLAVVGNLPAELRGETNTDRVVCTGPLDDVRPVVAGARALVFASLYEGFGLPLLEAMALDTAIITSNCSSMPEVVADAALLVEPTEVDDIAAALRRLAEDDTLYARLVEAGRRRLTRFSWQRAARETMAVYQRARH